MRWWSARIVFVGVVLFAGAIFFTGINWGLPSRAGDAFLFGDRPPWTGEQILALAGGWDDSAGRGADIAMHPLSGRDQPIVVNGTDAQRAAIVRRFRLYSAQPDEMITFRALSRMHPGKLDLDPQFFQYGGWWVYPVGILLKIASLLRLVSLRGDLAFYLDHPEAFGRFYLVARAYSAVWGIVGVAVVWEIARVWTGRLTAAALAAGFFATMPVVVNAAHEAKPHLAGSVLTLAAVLGAMRYVRSGQWRTALLSGAAAGAAFGMVLTGVVAFAVLPVMVLLRPMTLRRQVHVVLAAGAIGAGVFLAANPYLPIDLLLHRNVVQSNVGNYGNFYHPQLSMRTLGHAARLVATGTTRPLAIVASVAMAVWLIRRARATWRSPTPSGSAAGPSILPPGLGLLLAAPAVLVAIQFVLLASGKPAEYARFGLTLDAALAIGVAAAVTSFRGGSRVGLVLVLLTAVSALRYDFNFLNDRYDPSRLRAAAHLAPLAPPSGDAGVLALTAEPAPYCMPPADLFRWKWVLLPQGQATPPASLGTKVVLIRTADEWPAATTPGNVFPVIDDRLLTSPISWANKPMGLQRYRWPATVP